MFGTQSPQRCIVSVRGPLLRRKNALRNKPFPCEASSSGAGSDPYTILGVPQGADGERIESAYRKKKRLAEQKGDPTALKEIEDAHNSLFMASLNSRLAGKGPVDRSIRNADRVDLFPWRPRIYKGSFTLLKWSSIAYGAILLYNFLLKGVPQGVENAVVAGVVLNCWKQYQINPTAAYSDLQKRLENGWRNLFRGALLTCLATVAGIVVFWSGPDLAAELLKFRMPLMFYQSQDALLTLGAIGSNFLFTAFLR